MEKYTQKDIAAIIETISWDPVSFRRLCSDKQISVSDHDLVRSMHAWGIDPYATQNYPSNRNTRKR
jgi:hypothetical protein